MPSLKHFILWAVIGIFLIALFSQNFEMGETGQQLTYSSFVKAVQSQQVSKVVIEGYTISGELTNGQSFEVVRPAAQDPKLIDELLSHNIEVIGKRPEEPGIFRQLLVASFPILLITAIFIFAMRQMQGGMGGKGGPMSFGKSKARLLNRDEIKVTFADVAGVEEAKEEVQELVEFLKEPDKFRKVGGKIPKGVLMSGSPGTGKTLLAKAIAGEADVPFFSISGSDFVEMFVGVGASRVRDMFVQAKKHSPCILFIDEIDAVGRHRGTGMGGGHDEREQTLNQLLVEMDGFEGHEGVIVVAATNRPDVLDPALLRPGRFDRQVIVPLPDILGREQIMRVHLRQVPQENDVDPGIIARGTPGFSGADLANLVNESALFAARDNKKKIGMDELDRAKDKIMMGTERRSMVMTEEEKLNTAYHEAGHTIVGRMMPEHDPVYKVTIIPRGRALGVTMFLPEQDKYSHTKKALESQITSLFGGRIAEELVHGFDGVTTGASNDIERATKIAHSMVTKWGLSESMGPLCYSEEEGSPFLGRAAATSGSGNGHSQDTATSIDKEVRAIIDKSYAKATNILTEHKDKLDAMAQALMQYETLDSHQITEIMEGKDPTPPAGWDAGDLGDGGSSGTPPEANTTITAEHKDTKNSSDSLGNNVKPA